MKYLLIIFIILNFCFLSYSHEHWLSVYPKKGYTGILCKIKICSGHYFPKSSFALNKKLIYKPRVINPDKSFNPFLFKKMGTHLSGNYKFKNKGSHLLCFSIKKPQADEPLYYAKSVFIIPNETFNLNSYKIGKGLEIVPYKNISKLKSNYKLPLAILYNGSIVNGILTITPEKSNTYTLSTTKYRKALMPVKKNKRYLITSSYKGMSCSLTLYIH